MKELSLRILNLQASQTVVLDTRAKAMLANGADLINLGAGEPDFETTPSAKRAGIAAIEAGRTRYTDPSGKIELKRAVVAKIKRESNLDYGTEQIIITSGAKHAIHECIMALVNPGDEVLIPAPYWVTYPELVKLAGGVPVIISTDFSTDFKLKAEILEKHITAKSKLLVLNSPANPTGAVYTEAELQALADLIIKHDLFVLSDEIYERIIYPPAKHISLASLSEAMKARTLLVSGVSKSYAMTGWRIGYIAADLSISQRLAMLQSQITHHPSNISQLAAAAALNEDDLSVEEMTRCFYRRRELALKKVGTIPGLSVYPPDGAFYLFLGVEHFLGKKFGNIRIDTSLELCEYLLVNQGLAVIPGSAFGQEGYIRISYASADEKIQKGLERLEKGLLALQ